MITKPKDLKYGDVVRVSYRLREGGRQYDRVGFVQPPINDRELVLLSGRELRKYGDKVSLLRKIGDIFRLASGAHEELDNDPRVVIPYDSMFKIRILRE